jgi:hypothetical protein
MATLKELMGDKTRGDGRKFQDQYMYNNEWFEPIFLTNVDDGLPNEWHGLDERGCGQCFEDEVERYWKEWMPPKQTKKVKLYRPIYRSYENHYRSRASNSDWHTDKKIFVSNSIVGWMEMEVEVSE